MISNSKPVVLVQGFLCDERSSTNTYRRFQKLYLEDASELLRIQTPRCNHRRELEFATEPTRSYSTSQQKLDEAKGKRSLTFPAHLKEVLA
jgi:hypothetical protein